jgi:hypothetical protein
MEGLLQRLGAVNEMLKAMGGAEQRERHSQLQTTSLIKRIGEVQLDGNQWQTLLVEVQHCSLAVKDKERLLDVCSTMLCEQSVGGTDQGTAGMQKQDFRSAVHFMPLPVWQSFENESDAEGKFISFLLRLGLRLPTEPTYAMLSLFQSLASGSLAEVRENSPQTTRVLLHAFKTKFRDLAKLAGSWIQ